MSYSPERKSEDRLEDSKNEPSNEPVSYDVPPGMEPEGALDTHWHQFKNAWMRILMNLIIAVL